MSTSKISPTSMTRARRVLAALGALALLTAIGPAARAVNINTHGTACQPGSGSQAADFNYSQGGIVNAATGNRVVLCPVTRSPLPPTFAQATFYIDGTNPPGASTTCSLVSYDYTGVLLGSSNFTTSLATFDQLVNLTPAQATTYAYVSLFCSVPPQGTLLGVTSVQ